MFTASLHVQSSQDGGRYTRREGEGTGWEGEDGGRMKAVI